MKTTTDAMQIESVTRTHRTTTVLVSVEGKRFEFTRYLGGAWEVYDHPASWGGVPRFVGHLPTETGMKLSLLPGCGL